jgi:excisionase family DNA binding protein
MMRYLKIDQLADYLNCPRSTVRRLLDRGKLPIVEIGGNVLINRRGLDLKLKNQKDGWRVLLDE